MKNLIFMQNKPPSRIIPRALAGLACLMGMLVCQTALAQQYAMSNLWTVAVSNTLPFFNADNNTRGLAYNPTTDHLLVPSRGGGSNNVYILNSTDGSFLGMLPFNPSLVKGGTFVINMIDITEDGVIYVGNLTTDANGAAGPFKLYRWASETDEAQLVYEGDPSNFDAVTNNRRFGDSLILRGTGVGTQILLGTTATNVALLRTIDGTNFTATKITMNPTGVASGDFRYGIAWGAGNTFWAKQGTGNLKQITLDLVANTGAVTASVALPVGPGGPLGIDLSRNLLAIVETANSIATTTHKLRLFDISNPSAPVLVDAVQSFPVWSVNANLVGAVSMRNGRLYALDTNNGMLGYYLQGGIYYPLVFISQPANVTAWEGARNWTFTVANSGTPPYHYQWQFDGVEIPGATTTSYVLPPIGITNDWDTYSVVVSNNSSVRTSAVATVRVLPGNASSQASNIWDILPNTRPYLTSEYKEYGVAINPLTTNVIVVTRANPTNMLAVLDIETGAHKHYIDYSAYNLPVNKMNKVTVADDGVVFTCSITADAGSNPFDIFGFQDDGPMPLSGFLFEGDPGLDKLGVRVLPANIGWGANIDARGGGMDTEILIGAGRWNATTYDANAAAMLRYDSLSGLFYSTPIVITNLPVSNNNFRFGICWGAGDSFWAKGLANLMYIEFDRVSGKGGVVRSYPTSGSRSVPSSVTAMSFDPVTSLIVALQNGASPAPVSVNFYDVSDPMAGPFWVDQELFASYNADIEYQGSVSFEKGYAVALGVNNGLKAFKLNPSFTASLPVILANPVGGEWFADVSSPLLSVVADSLTPISYQWYHETQLLAGQTNSSITITNITLAQGGDYWVRVSNAGGPRDSVPARVSVLPFNNTAQMTNIWSVAPGSRPYLNTAYFEYGMAFNPVNSNLLVASYVSTNPTPVIIGVMDALTGAHKHTLDVTGISGGNRWVNKIGVTDDGVVYAANRTTASASDPLKIYRWANDEASTVPTVAFSGDPFPTRGPNRLAGWVMDVRGSGVNTEILLSTSATNVLSVLQTTDGFTFTPTDFVVDGAPADFARLGICFGAGNTFWVKTWQGSLYLVQYDLTARTGTILKTYDTTEFPAAITTLAYNDNLKFLAGAARDDQKNIQLFSVADLDAPPVMVDQEIYPSSNPSIEANGALDFGGDTYLFGMNENNGVIAFLIQPPVTAFKILNTVVANGQITLTWAAEAGVTYQVKYSASLSGPWGNVGSPVTASGPTATYTEAASGGGFYRIAK